jgi:hypothetical protein
MASKQKGGEKNFLIEFMDVTNEERNKIVKFIRDPLDSNLADKSKNLHCMIFPCSTIKTEKTNTHKI